MKEWSWIALAGLGAYHGINPAMGWLFAVSQGLQQRDRRAVLRSLIPIAAGHEASLLAVAAIVLGAGAVVSTAALHIGAAVVLIAFGIFRFVKPRAHFRWTTMRVTAPELGWWSFLMATAHGAGLMVAPVLIGGTAAAAEAHDHEVAMVRHEGVPLITAVGDLLLHIAVMLLVMGIVAVVVYDRLGVEVLRRAWLNTEQIWAVAFVFAGVVTLLS
jgi:hypothetical protein